MEREGDRANQRRRMHLSSSSSAACDQQQEQAVSSTTPLSHPPPHPPSLPSLPPLVTVLVRQQSLSRLPSASSSHDTSRDDIFALSRSVPESESAGSADTSPANHAISASIRFSSAKLQESSFFPSLLSLSFRLNCVHHAPRPAKVIS